MDQQIRFCDTPDGVTLAYATIGAGPPLVKAPNWLNHVEHDVKSPIWRPVFERLARGRTLVRYDERGCGLSDWDVDDLSFEAWVRDLEAVVDAAGLERFPLLGMSQGAAIALSYVIRNPGRVSHLILYGGSMRGPLRRDPTPRRIEEVETLIKLIRIGWGRDNPAYRQVFTSMFLPDGSLEQIRAFTELQRVSSSAENAARIVAEFDSIDLTDLAPRVDVPTLVVHARDDARIPFEEGRLTASLIPDAEFVPLESRNHVPLEGTPAFDRLFDEIDRFLAPDGAAEPSNEAEFRELTPRERQVLDLVARGLDNASVAERLYISPKTVRNHITRIFSKLRVGRRAEAIVRAREAGFGRASERA